jgi:hypothetical protein
MKFKRIRDGLWRINTITQKRNSEMNGARKPENETQTDLWGRLGL